MEDAPFYDVPPGGMAPGRVWWMEAADGTRLRAAHWRPDAPRALAVLLSGRTEFLEKFALPAACLTTRGYEVVSLDWRGQGLSDRSTDEVLKGNVGDFAEYQLDLDALLSSGPVVDSPHDRTLLLGHSMGGCIATAAVLREEIAARVDALVLSAPMYGIALPKTMRAAARVVTTVGHWLGHHDRWPPFGDSATPYVLTDAEPNLLTHDEEIWDWLVRMAERYPELNLAMPTLGWFRAAAREMRRLAGAPALGLPALALLGGDERVVDPDAVRSTSAHLGIELVEIETARHEHFHEMPELRARAWAAIDRFLAAHGLPAA